MPEIIEVYLEVLSPVLNTTFPNGSGGEVVYRDTCADYADAVVQWSAIRADWPGCTAQFHYHHHGDAAEPCTLEVLP